VTPAKALTQLSGTDGIYKKLEDAIDGLLWSWGIDLESISLKPFGYSHALNEAVLEVPKAQREKEAQIIRAEGAKQATILAGEGKGKAKKAELDEETDGRKRMASELGVNGAAILAAETARGVTNNPGQKTIIAGSGGFKDLAMVGTILGETLNEQKGATS
jgi:regulator of protease activity HflC (stomatin/prohibitin superfamily)